MDVFLQVPSGDKPVYMRLAEAVRAAVASGQLRPGERLPATRLMARQLGIHRHTVLRAMAELEAEGWVSASMRRRYEVAQWLPGGWEKRDVLSAGKVVALDWDRYDLGFAASGPRDTGSWPVDFQAGTGDFRLFPIREFRSYFGESLRKVRSEVFQRGYPGGHPQMIETLCGYLRRARGIEDRSLLITNGSQEGIYLAGQVLLKRGDGVALDGLGYPPAWQALRAAGGLLRVVESDGQGMLPDALARAVDQHAIGLIYLTPLHHFPTGRTMSMGRRQEIYNLAARCGIPILEDDYDHEFHYGCLPHAPMAANDPAQIVVYVSTLSKVLFPSARLGFLVLPHRAMHSFGQMKSIVNGHNETLLQDCVARWTVDGGLERHMRRLAKHYLQRRNCLWPFLQRGMQMGLIRDAPLPDGGLFYWVDMGRDSRKLALQLEGEGIKARDESLYRLDGEAGRHLQLGFAQMTPAEIGRAGERLLSGLARLGGVASAVPSAACPRHQEDDWMQLNPAQE